MRYVLMHTSIWIHPLLRGAGFNFCNLEMPIGRFIPSYEWQADITSDNARQSVNDSSHPARGRSKRGKRPVLSV